VYLVCMCECVCVSLYVSVRVFVLAFARDPTMCSERKYDEQVLLTTKISSITKYNSAVTKTTG